MNVHYHGNKDRVAPSCCHHSGCCHDYDHGDARSIREGYFWKIHGYNDHKSMGRASMLGRDSFVRVALVVAEYARQFGRAYLGE